MLSGGFVTRSANPRNWETAGEAFFMGKKMNNYEKYEAMKRDWVQANPSATNEEYQNAMRRIAAKCGV